MCKQMKAGVVHAPFDIRYEDVPLPAIKEHEVLVRVAYTGICGSDIPRVNGTASHFYPNILGHEFSGTVVETGSGVTQVASGDRVAGVPLLPCMKCSDCKDGNFSLCKHYKFVGSSVQGSFAEYVSLPEKNVVKFSNTVTFEQGAFFEPATVALHGIWCADYKPGGHVAVLGGGTIGMFTAQWAKILGAKSVVVFDIASSRLDLAKRLGANAAINTSNKSFKEEALEYCDGRGFDYVYETAGNTITMHYAFELAANKSHVCFIGTPTKDLTFTPRLWENMNRKEFNLTGSWMSYSNPFPGKEWSYVPEYFANGKLKIDDSFIYKKVPLSEIADAFKMFTVPGKVSGKVFIDCGGATD